MSLPYTKYHIVCIILYSILSFILFVLTLHYVSHSMYHTIQHTKLHTICPLSSLQEEVGEENMNPLRFAKLCKQRRRAAEVDASVLNHFICSIMFCLVFLPANQQLKSILLVLLFVHLIFYSLCNSIFRTLTQKETRSLPVYFSHTHTFFTFFSLAYSFTYSHTYLHAYSLSFTYSLPLTH